ncbi:MAG: peptidoglycan editing factor PgeF [Proteobacteria bacterium]|nr:peptidoglycan editing factor PgeF [Pseudomonadota bacterium]
MLVRSTQLGALTGVRHGFLTREGGVSQGAYASLNCGRANGDTIENVAENRRRALAAVDPNASALCTVRQVHGSAALQVAAAWPINDPPAADALITNRRGIALGVTSADCAPVLIADPAAGIIAAAHAGWRGALSGIVESTVAAMVAIGGVPNRMIAAIGPCIARHSYEVGEAFPAPFLAQDAANARFFAPAAAAPRFQFDLPGYVASRITAAGLAKPEVIELDTCAEEGRFFSYRRACLRQETAYGLGISMISRD